MQVMYSLVPDIRESNLLVTEAIDSINVSFNDTASLLQATQTSLEIGEEVVISVLKLLDQASAIFVQTNCSVAYDCSLHNIINRCHCQFSFQMTVF